MAKKTTVPHVESPQPLPVPDKTGEEDTQLVTIRVTQRFRQFLNAAASVTGRTTHGYLDKVFLSTLSEQMVVAAAAGVRTVKAVTEQE